MSVIICRPMCLSVSVSPIVKWWRTSAAERYVILSVCVPVCPFICLTVCLCVNVCVCLYLLLRHDDEGQLLDDTLYWRSVCVYLPVCMCGCLNVLFRLCIWLDVYLLAYLSVCLHIWIFMMYNNVPKVFVKFVDVTLQMRCVTNLKCRQHRRYLANAVEISYLAILML